MSLIIEALSKARGGKLVTGQEAQETRSYQDGSSDDDDLLQEFRNKVRSRFIRRDSFSTLLLTTGIIAILILLLALSKPGPLSLTAFPQSSARSQHAAPFQREDRGPLRGIYQDPSGSVCLLGHKIYRVGDLWNGLFVSQIQQDAVRLKSANGEETILRWHD